MYVCVQLSREVGTTGPLPDPRTLSSSQTDANPADANYQSTFCLCLFWTFHIDTHAVWPFVSGFCHGTMSSQSSTFMSQCGILRSLGRSLKDHLACFLPSTPQHLVWLLAYDRYIVSPAVPLLDNSSWAVTPSGITQDTPSSHHIEHINTGSNHHQACSPDPWEAAICRSPTPQRSH
jgi:hypothetical protein